MTIILWSVPWIRAREYEFDIYESQVLYQHLRGHSAVNYLIRVCEHVYVNVKGMFL